MKYLFILFIFTISPLFGKTGVERSEILKLIPAEFSSLTKSDSYDDISSRFKDKISNSNKQKTLFLKYFGKDNDVTIGFDKGQFSYLLIKLPKQEKSSLFQKIYDSLSEDEKKKLVQINTSSGHTVGRDITVDLKDQSLRLKFKNDNSKTLQSVLIWSEGSKAP